MDSTSASEAELAHLKSPENPVFPENSKHQVPSKRLKKCQKILKWHSGVPLFFLTHTHTLHILLDMKTRRNMLLPDDLWEDLVKEAKKKGVSVTALVIIIIRDHMERNNKE